MFLRLYRVYLACPVLASEQAIGKALFSALYMARTTHKIRDLFIDNETGKIHSKEPQQRSYGIVDIFHTNHPIKEASTTGQRQRLFSVLDTARTTH
jgi:hypothetical protein